MAEHAASDPYWWEAAPPPRPEPALVAPSCDVAIVGAGYTGLSAGLTLARAGRAVQVFDRQRPGEGASTRNGGIASGNIRLSLGAMIEALGRERAVAIYGEAKAAREDLARFIAEEKIDCDYRMTGRFTGAMTPAAYETMAREADRLNRHFNLGAYPVPRAAQHAEVGTDRYHGGLVRPDIGGLHPAKFLAGILARACESGVRVHGETAVTGIRREGDGVEIETARGRVRGRVRARHAIVATNGYTDGCDPWLRRRLVPVPSSIVATEPLPPETMRRLMPKGRMLGESRKLYHYHRPSPDGTRILFGGRGGLSPGDERRAGLNLRRKLIEVFPELAAVRITHSWGGYVAFNQDHMPRLFARSGIVYAAGYCGSGVVWAPWLGRKAALRVLGEPAGASALSAPPPRAVPLYGGKPWFLPAAIAWYGLQDRLSGAEKRPRAEPGGAARENVS